MGVRDGPDQFLWCCCFERDDESESAFTDVDSLEINFPLAVPPTERAWFDLEVVEPDHPPLVELVVFQPDPP